MYKNINGQVQRVEKQFDDPEQMNEFVKWYDDVNLPYLWRGNLDHWFDQMFDRRFALGNSSKTSEEEQLYQLKQEKRKIEQEEQQQAQRQSKLKWLIEEAKSLKEFFEQRWQGDKVKQAEETIISYEQQLNKS